MTSPESEQFNSILEIYLNEIIEGKPFNPDRIKKQHPEIADELIEALEFFSDLEVEKSHEGKKIGNFEIKSILGKGGIGIVYEATDKQLDRQIALKMLPGWITSNSSQAKRFIREARISANLKHPNIVQVHSYGIFSDEALPFYVMELIEGKTLAELAQIGIDNLPGGNRKEKYKNLARIFMGACQGLEYAHKNGVIHRDVKPGNMILDDNVQEMESKLKILDFGLAQIDGATAITRPGGFIGTPSHISPEQIKTGKNKVDHRSDIYGLGASLYECLTLYPPFNFENVHETIRHVIEEDPQRPSRIQSWVPKDLEIITLKCLEKNPSDRYQSAQELYEDLERYVEDRPIKAVETTLFGRAVKITKRNPVLASLTAILLVLSIFLGFALRDSTLNEKTSNTHLNSFRQLTMRTAISQGDYFQAMVLATENDDELNQFLFHTLKDVSPSITDQGELEPSKNEKIIIPQLRGQEYLVLNSLDRLDRLFLLDDKSQNIKVFIWDKNSYQKISEFKIWASWTDLQLGDVNSKAAITSDGAMVATVSDTNLVEVFSFSGDLLFSIEGKSIIGVSFSPSNKYLIGTSNDGHANTWDTKTGKHVGEYSNGSIISSTAMNSDETIIATGCVDGKVLFWSIDGKHIPPILRHRGAIKSINLLGKRKFQCVLSSGKFATWELPESSLKFSHKKSASSVAVSESGSIVSASLDGDIWLSTGERAQLPYPVNDIQFLDENHIGFYANRSIYILKVDSRTWTVEGLGRTWAGESGIDRFTVHGDYIALQFQERVNLFNWRTVTYKTHIVHPCGRLSLRTLDFSNDGKRLVTSTFTEGVDHCGQALRVWNTENGKQLAHQGMPVGKRINKLDHSPGGEFVGVVSQTGFYLFRSDNLEPVGSFGGNFDQLKFSNEDHIAVSHSESSKVFLLKFDISSNDRIAPALEPIQMKGATIGFGFIDDPRAIVTASSSGEVDLWSLSTGERISPTLDAGSAIKGFKMVYRTVSVACEDGSVHVWKIPETELKPIEGLKNEAQFLSGLKLNSIGKLEQIER